MINEYTILQDRMSNIKKRMTIAELLGISSRFKHLENDEDDKRKYISQLLFSFNIIEQNKYLDIMITDLAYYRKHVHNNKQNNKPESNIPPSTKSLFHYLEKMLLEISYISNQKKRNEKITELYEWYIDKKKCDEELKNITMKTYKEKGEIDEQEKILMEKKHKKTINIDDSSHRNLELINKKMLNEFVTKRLLGSLWENKKFSQFQSLKPLSLLDKDPMIQTLSLFSNDFLPGDGTTLYSSANGNNPFTKRKYNNESPSYIDKPEGGLLEKDYNSQILSDNKSFLPSLNRETKYSYSYLRPPYGFNEAYLENKIIEGKQKSLAIKRAQEEIKEKIKEYGIARARYKEFVNNKYELKNMINKYVSRNGLSSPLLRKYKSKNFTENLDNKNNENNNLNSDINNKNISMNLSSSNNSSLSKNKYISTNKNEIMEEIELNLSSNKRIMKNQSYKNVRLLDKRSMRKVSFSISLSQRTKDINLREGEKESNDNDEQFEILSPKRSISFRKKSKTKKRNSNRSIVIPELRLFSGNNTKIKIDNIRNLDFKSKNILNIANIKKNNYDISLPQDKIKSQILENNKNNIEKIPDSMSYIISNLPIIKDKLLLSNLCHIKSRNGNKLIESKTQEQKKNVHLSLNKDYLKSFIPNESINIKKNYFRKLNQRYDLYKHNFLKLRKSMSDDKKKEYEKLFNKLRGKTIINNNDYYEDENFENENKKNNSYLLNIESGKTNRFKKNNSLLEAIVNPNDNSIYSRYYLPRNGSSLLSRNNTLKGELSI